MLGRIGLGPVTSIKTYPGKRDTTYLFLSQILFSCRVVNRLTQLVSSFWIISAPYAWVAPQSDINNAYKKITSRDSDVSEAPSYKELRHWNKYIFLFIATNTWGFRCNQLRKVKVKVKSMTPTYMATKYMSSLDLNLRVFNTKNSRNVHAQSNFTQSTIIMKYILTIS